MKNSVCVQSELKSKKEWANPQLKKIDIEAITAANSNVFADAGGFGS
jgi:hypothetical protein